MPEKRQADYRTPGDRVNQPVPHSAAPVPVGSAAVFDGFEQLYVETDRGSVHARVGGAGPPLLVLHGYPESHLMWHGCADELAQRFTLVAADLPGYGDSHRPAPAADHTPHSKRATANDLVQVMTALGFERFAVAGHDRGGRVAYRMALDRPDRVHALAVLDIVPTAEVWARADARLALAYWHWGFLAAAGAVARAVDRGRPRRLLRAPHQADGDRRGATDVYPKSVLDAYRRQLRDPAVVQAICEDYRAGATIDRDHDEADRAAGNRVEAPLLALWAGRGALPLLYDDVAGDLARLGA